jgi:hypothetical protein
MAKEMENNEKRIKAAFVRPVFFKGLRSCTRKALGWLRRNSSGKRAAWPSESMIAPGL